MNKSFSAWWAVCLICAGCAAAPAPTPAIISATDAAARTEAVWSGLAKSQGLLWQWRLTPYLPSEWPPAPTTTWTRYAYGTGRDPQLADGERISAPWGRIDSRAGAATFTQLSKDVSPKAIQGTGPVRPEDAAPLRSSEAVNARVTTLTGLPDAGLPETRETQAFYRAWFALNGVVADEIGLPSAFKAWVSAAPAGAPITFAIGDSRTIAPGITLTLLSVDEDSRCPTDGKVMCVWSGVASFTFEAARAEIRERLKLSSIDAPKSYTRTAEFAGQHITLISVLPEATTGGTIDRARYRVSLTVTAR